MQEVCASSETAVKSTIDQTTQAVEEANVNMTDYGKNTVAQIREIFKERGIPATGLTKKQQLIDRLQEEDAKTDDGPAGTSEPTRTTGDDEQPLNASDHATTSEAASAPDPATNGTLQPDDATEDAKGPDAQPSDSAAVNESAREEVEKIADEAEPDAPGDDDESRKPLITKDTAVEKDIPGFDEAAQYAEAATKAAQDAREPPASGLVTGETPAADTSVEVDASSNANGSLPEADATTEQRPSTPSSENRKRKRRSMTPPVSSIEVANKKARQDHEGPVPPVVLPEDTSKASEPADADVEMTTKPDIEETIPAPVAQAAAEESKAGEVQHQAEAAANDAKSIDIEQPTLITSEQSASIDVEKPTGSKPDSPVAPTKIPPGREGRYKELLSPTGKARQNLDGVDQQVDEEEDRTISPAVHPATSALYIRDLMRPLKDQALKAHLASLARSRSDTAEDDGDSIIKDFYLDTIKTHCFAVFESVSTASRARSALHERVWPPEGNRKPLYVDFVPEEKVQQWIDHEQQTGGTRASTAKRWEVVYDKDEEGAVTCELREAGSASVAAPPRRTNSNIPTGPAAAASAPDGRKPSVAPKASAAEQAPSFLALDQLFQSTTAKPKLYYKPVSKDLVDKRLDELDARTTKTAPVPPGGSGLSDSTRYTFEDGDLLVDNGPEFGLRSLGRDFAARRGGRGGFRGR